MFNFAGFIKGLFIQDENDRTKQLIFTISPSSTSGTKTTVTANQTANRNITLPDSDLDLNTIVTASSTTTFTNKSIDADVNTISNIDNDDVRADAAIALTKLAALTANRVLQSDGSGNISASSVTNTTLGFLDATSSIQTQLNGKVATSAVIDIAHGGTGQTTANAALNALLPSQASNSGKVLATDGTNTSWQTVGGGTSANQSLSNLASTAVNADILPGTTNSINLGSGVKQYASVNASSIYSWSPSPSPTSEIQISAAGTPGIQSFQNSGSPPAFTITTQNSPSLPGQPINIATGAGNATTTGAIALTTGSVGGGPGIGGTGGISLQSGNTSGSSASGSIAIASGTGVFGSGDITLTVGSSSSDPLRGKFKFVKTDTPAVVGQKWTASGTDGTGYWASKSATISSSSGLFLTTSTTATPVTNLSVSITTSGGPVKIELIADGASPGTNNSGISTTNASAGTAHSYIQVTRNGSQIGTYDLVANAAASSGSTFITVPSSSVSFLDAPTAGTYTYAISAYSLTAASTTQVNNTKLAVYEI